MNPTHTTQMEFDLERYLDNSRNVNILISSRQASRMDAARQASITC